MKNFVSHPLCNASRKRLDFTTVPSYHIINMPEPLGPLKLKRRGAKDPFHADGKPLGFQVLDFWRWSASDLLTNATRAMLAEFIVARALGVSTSGVRDEWGAFDLTTPDGLEVEVRSAAYLQSCNQKNLSKIQFSIAQSPGWDRRTNMGDTAQLRHSDVFVFALLAHKDKQSIDPLNLRQWEFYVVRTRQLNDRTRGRQAVTLPALQKLTREPVAFHQLRKAVAAAVSG